MAEKKGSDDKSAEGNKSKKKLYLFIGIGVLVLVIALVLGWYFFLKKSPEQTDKDSELQVPVPSISRNSEIGPMVDIKEFIVNIISEDERHYVKAALTLELSSDAVLEEVQKRIPQIRDSILLLTGNKTYEELQDLQGKKQLKAELIVKINAILQTGTVKAIYFTDFVVQ